MRIENWVNVPTNSVLTIHKQTVMVHPIIDKFYSRNPNHLRSSAFVQTKGLLANEKAPIRQSCLPDLEGTAHRKTAGGTVPLGAKGAHGSPPRRLSSPLSTRGRNASGWLAEGDSEQSSD